MDFNFEGVSDVDKLAIIFSAIHHSITNRWGLLAWNGEFKSNLPEYNYYTFWKNKYILLFKLENMDSKQLHIIEKKDY